MPAGEADDLERLLGPRAADHGAHHHLEPRAPRELDELEPKRVEHLHGDGIALDAVDADLEVGQSGIVQGFDQLRCEQVSVGDQLPPAEAELAHPRDDANELRVEGRLATGEAHDPGAQLAQLEQPLVERLERDGRRVIVVLVAIAAAQVAAPGHDQLHEEGTEPQPLGNRQPARARGALTRRGCAGLDLAGEHWQAEAHCGDSPVRSPRSPSDARASTSAPQSVSGMNCMKW